MNAYIWKDGLYVETRPKIQVLVLLTFVHSWQLVPLAFSGSELDWHRKLPARSWLHQRRDSTSYDVPWGPGRSWTKCKMVINMFKPSSNGNICLVTGPLCGEFIGRRRIPRTKANDEELWYFLSCVPQWLNGWVYNRETGDLGRLRAHYDVIVMLHNTLFSIIISRTFILVQLTIDQHWFR